MNNGGRRRQEEVEVVEGADDKAFIWKLPHIKLKETGKIGPAFGLGAGCGVGFGFGVVGGMGIGPGNPGFQMGFGLGAGCGVGFGFGYGLEGVLLMMSIGCILMLGNWLIHNVCLLRIDEFVINRQVEKMKRLRKY